MGMSGSSAITSDVLFFTPVAEVQEFKSRSDHDLLLECCFGIKSILEKLVAAEKRVDGVDVRVKEISTRVDSLEQWRTRSMMIAGSIGTVAGLFGKSVMDAALHVFTGGK